MRAAGGARRGLSLAARGSCRLDAAAPRCRARRAWAARASPCPLLCQGQKRRWVARMAALLSGLLGLFFLCHFLSIFFYILSVGVLVWALFPRPTRPLVCSPVLFFPPDMVPLRHLLSALSDQGWRPVSRFFRLVNGRRAAVPSALAPRSRQRAIPEKMTCQRRISFSLDRGPPNCGVRTQKLEMRPRAGFVPHSGPPFTKKIIINQHAESRFCVGPR